MSNDSDNTPTPENQPSTDEPVLEFPSAEDIDQIASEGVLEQSAEPIDELMSLKEQLADAEKRVLMAHADLDNFRRRNLRETQEQIKYAPGKLMTEILEAVDNLGRAVESYENDQSGEGLNNGVKMVATQILTMLEKHGCKRIEAVGQPYDPNFHQALQMQPSEEFESNTVMMDLRSGFQLHDRVLRPSQVFVSTGVNKE